MSPYELDKVTHTSPTCVSISLWGVRDHYKAKAFAAQKLLSDDEILKKVLGVDAKIPTEGEMLYNIGDIFNSGIAPEVPVTPKPTTVQAAPPVEAKA